MPQRYSKILFPVLILSLSTFRSLAIDPDFARFLKAKKIQIQELAETQTNKVPASVEKLFDTISADDYPKETNLFAQLEEARGRFREPPLDDMARLLQGPAWPPISEVSGTYEVFHDWDHKWLQRFGNDIIDSIPRGSVYFGGTEDGRFIISALVKSHRGGDPFFVLTQNQLADSNYMNYLAGMFAKQVHLPNEEETSQVFSIYVTGAQQRYQAGKLRLGEDVSITGGQIKVGGVTAVMTINGLLVKWILDHNPDRSFFIEESIAIDELYPNLTPHGLIMELQHKPVPELPESMIRKDADYWRKLTGELIGDWIGEKTSTKELSEFVEKVYLRKDFNGFAGDAAFAKNSAARKGFSKLRDSLGGLYAWRADQPAENRRLMQQNAELAFRQAFAICPANEVVDRYSQLLIKLNRTPEAILLVKTALRIDPQNGAFNHLLQTLQDKVH